MPITLADDVGDVAVMVTAIDCKWYSIERSGDEEETLEGNIRRTRRKLLQHERCNGNEKELRKVDCILDFLKIYF